MVDVGQVQVLEKYPETRRKKQQNASLSFPPPQTHFTHHMVVQELPSRLHWARFSKLQASFKLKPIWRKLTKVPCSQEQWHNHSNPLHPAYMHANSEQYQHHQNTIMSQPSWYADCTLSQPVHAKYHIRCELWQYTARYPRHRVVSLSTDSYHQIQAGNRITYNSVFIC